MLRWIKQIIVSILGLPKMDKKNELGVFKNQNLIDLGI